MAEQLALLPEYLNAHVQLTLLALLCSAALSLPLGIASTALGVPSSSSQRKRSSLSRL